MNKKNWPKILYILAAISFGISIYQFVDSRPFMAVLSLVYTAGFIINGVITERKTKKEGSHEP